MLDCDERMQIMNNLRRRLNGLRWFGWGYQFDATTWLLWRNILDEILRPCHFNHAKHSHLPSTYQHLSRLMYFLPPSLLHFFLIFLFKSRIAAHSLACIASLPIIMMIIIVFLENQLSLQFWVRQEVTFLAKRLLLLMP